MLVVRDVTDDRRPVALVGPEVLGYPAGVAGDHGVGGGQDVLGGAVVLLQQDHPGAGEITLELLDVPDRRAAEGVDGLVGVADHTQLCRADGRSGLVLARRHDALSGELSDQDILRMIGVLVLVDEDVPEPAPVRAGDLGERLQQVDRDHDQVVKVHRAGRDEPALVLGVGLGGRLLPVPAGAGGGGLVVDQVVLEVGDLRDHRLRRVVLGIKLKLAADQRHQPPRVGLVVDRERRRVAEPPRFPAQDPDAGRVERQQPHGPSPRPGERRGPGRHLPRRLVGERDGQDLGGRDAPLGQQVGDPVGQHAGLARAGPGHDEQRAALVHDGSALLRVQPVQEGINGRRGHPPSVGAGTDAGAQERAAGAATRPARASAWPWSGSPS